MREEMGVEEGGVLDQRVLCHIKAVNEKNELYLECSGLGETSLTYEEAFVAGDQLVFSAAPPVKHLIISVNDVFEKVMVYAPDGLFSYRIPFGEDALCYPPQAFEGNRHQIKLRAATDSDLLLYRNLALNPLDQENGCNTFPHASSNNETRGEPVFSARNSIDGYTKSCGHGIWPYTSWGPDIEQPASLRIAFGRPVMVDLVQLYLRTDFPHDAYWRQCDLVFSDGARMPLSLKKMIGPQAFSFPKRKTEWIQVENLVKAEEEAIFPALVQMEVWGRDDLTIKAGV